MGEFILPKQRNPYMPSLRPATDGSSGGFRPSDQTKCLPGSTPIVPLYQQLNEIPHLSGKVKPLICLTSSL